MMQQPKKLETYHETLYVKEVTADGAICLKLYTRGYNDRLTLMDCNIHFFIEFKREGNEGKLGKRKGEKLQIHRHEELKKRGHHTYVCYNYEEAIAIYNRYKAKCNSKKRNTVKKVRGNVYKPHVKK